MSSSSFSQNTIACVWDFDLTLSPHYMQRPLFSAYGIDEAVFWQEVRGLSDHYRSAGLQHIADDTMYLNHLLTYARQGLLPGLTNARLRKLGEEISFFPGLPHAFKSLSEQVASSHQEIRLEHYVVSNGMAEMIRGSALAPFLDGIWACEFIESPALPGYLDGKAEEEEPLIAQLGYVIDNTTKTRAIFEINKGANKGEIAVNDSLAHDQRRIPFEQMIYVADGPSDIPVFSLIRQNHGRCCAVYDPSKRESFSKANKLLQQGRVEHHAPADYQENSPLSLWLSTTIDEMCEAIDKRQQETLRRNLGKTPASY